MKISHRLSLLFVSAILFCLPACPGDTGDDDDSGGSSGGDDDDSTAEPDAWTDTGFVFNLTTTAAAALVDDPALWDLKVWDDELPDIDNDSIGFRASVGYGVRSGTHVLVFTDADGNQVASGSVEFLPNGMTLVFVDDQGAGETTVTSLSISEEEWATVQDTEDANIPFVLHEPTMDLQLRIWDEGSGAYSSILETAPTAASSWQETSFPVAACACFFSRTEDTCLSVGYFAHPSTWDDPVSDGFVWGLTMLGHSGNSAGAPFFNQSWNQVSGYTGRTVSFSCTAEVFAAEGCDLSWIDPYEDPSSGLCSVPEGW